jgi:hypothetical protein
MLGGGVIPPARRLARNGETGRRPAAGAETDPAPRRWSDKVEAGAVVDGDVAATEKGATAVEDEAAAAEEEAAAEVDMMATAAALAAAEARSQDC